MKEILTAEEMLSKHFAPTEKLTTKKVLSCMQEFAAQPQPTAEGAEEMLMRINKYDCMGPDMSDSYVLKRSALAAMNKFATLHAQRIADKMVEEKLKEELIKYNEWIISREGVGLIGYDSVLKVNNYLKSRKP